MGGGTLDNTITFQENPLRVFDDPCNNFTIFTKESFNQWITDTCNNEAHGFTEASLNYLVSFDAPWQIIGSNVLKDLSNIDICNTGGASLTDKFEFAGVVTDICASAFENMGLSGDLDFSRFSALTIIGPKAFSKNNFNDTIIFGKNSTLTDILSGSSMDSGAFYNSNISGQLDLSGLSALESIGVGTFSKNKITALDLSGLNYLRTIYDYAFSDNSISSVNFNGLSNLQNIYDVAFSANLLSNLELKDLSSLVYIGINTFRQNIIDDISLLNCPSLGTIGNDAFDNNPLKGSLTLRNVPSLAAFPHNAIDVSGFTGDLELTGTGFTEIGDFSNGSFQGSLKINDNQNLSSINDFAFYNTKFTSLELSGNNALTTIQKDSFANNNFVDGVTFTNCPSLQSIGEFFSSGDGAFYLSNINGPLDLKALSALQTIGELAFSFNNISSVDFSGLSALQTIGDYAFTHNSLTSVDFTGLTALQTIGEYAFHMNISLTSVDFNGLTALQTIGDSAFLDNEISSVDFTGLTALQTIGDSAFESNQLTDISFINDPSLSSIQSSAFENNPLTGSLTLRNVPSLAAFPHNAIPTASFEGDLELTGTGFTEIGGFSNGSFQGSLTINDNLDLSSINESAFSDNSFTSLELSGNTSLTIIEPLSFTGNSFSQGVIFTNCPSLQIIGKNSFEQANISGELDFSGLESLTDICNGAFNINNLNARVKFGNNSKLQILDNNSLQNCQITGLLDLSPLNGLTKIGKNTFRNNSINDKVIFENCLSLNLIDERAFDAAGISGEVDFSGIGALTISYEAFLNNPDIIRYVFNDNSGTTIGINVDPSMGGVLNTGTGSPSITWDNSGFDISSNGEYIFVKPPINT